MGLDGRIAPGPHHPAGPLAPEVARWLDGLFAQADAVLFGARTIALDDPVAREALPVAVSGRGLVSPGAALLRGPRRALVVTSELAPAAKRQRLAETAEVVVLGERRVEPARLLHHLEREHGARRVLCAGGARLAASLLEAGVVGALHVALLPAAGGVELAPGPLCGPTCAARFTLVDQQSAGDTLFLEYRVDGQTAQEAR